MKDMKSQWAWRRILRYLNCKVLAAVILINAIVSSNAVVLVVSTLADSGPGSLRDRVAVSSREIPYELPLPEPLFSVHPSTFRILSSYRVLDLLN